MRTVNFCLNGKIFSKNPFKKFANKSNLSFVKEKRSTFFFAKKKKVPKKKLATLQLDRLSALCFEAR